MTLADTGRAIGAVTELLDLRLTTRTTLNVSVGRPESAGGGVANPRLNLFLYEAQFDPSLRNVSLDEGRPAPLWLVLRYVMTAFDAGGDSDTTEAHTLLGRGLSALQEFGFLHLSATTPATVLSALQDNPEPLKVTFDETPSDLLSRLMQGTDEVYRFSLGFQVRPVMIATGEPPSYSLLVGVDNTVDPAVEIGEEGINIVINPSMGQEITNVEPAFIEATGTLTIEGIDLHFPDTRVRIGPAEMTITEQRQDKLTCTLPATVAAGGVMSAGSHPLFVVRTLPNGRQRTSNLLVVHLQPTVTGAAPNGLQRVVAADAQSSVFG
ncbi:MAG: DUF4255 domain-containing protein, partial [Chloroflexota bacterium]|nr:DUF4255 domain-containing protein [Chloroflexota bacterium]